MQNRGQKRSGCRGQSKTEQSKQCVQEESSRNQIGGVREPSFRLVLGNVLDHCGVDAQVEDVAVGDQRADQHPEAVLSLAEVGQHEWSEHEPDDEPEHSAREVTGGILEQTAMK